MHKLHVILTSTRPVRIGESVSQWFVEKAKAHGKLEVTFVDLKEVNLPMFDEPEHPRFGKYVHAHTKAWSALVSAADAFVFVLPEYNYSMPPAFVNAITYLSKEWAYKAAGIVSYGGVSAGTRSAQVAKQLMTSVKIMPIPEAVSIPMVGQFVDEKRQFNGNDALDKSVGVMLDELLKWTGALKTLR